jgi:LacI family transcriptional regulator
MATLKDISRRLGLSVTTVSRALNGFPEVNEQTRALVEQTARDMKYRPNQFARKLVTGQSGMVGYVLRASPELVADPHFIEVITGLSEEFSAREIDFILHVSPDDDVLATYRRLVARGRFDGFVLSRPVIGDVRVDFLLEEGIPFVMHGRVPGDVRYPFYDIDNYEVGYRLANHLAGLGHRRIAFLNGPLRRGYASERHRGFTDALAAHGLAPLPDLMRHDIHTLSYGVRVAGELLALGPRAPTAIMCTHSLIARGVVETLSARGIAVPGDISVVSHDDGPTVSRDAMPMPDLTVTRSPLRQACRPLAELLVRRIAGEPTGALQVTVQPEFILRTTTASVPAIAQPRT